MATARSTARRASSKASSPRPRFAESQCWQSVDAWRASAGGPYSVLAALWSVSRTAVKTGERMPALTTTFDVLLQMVTVGLGSPLGREVAPRELGGMIAGWLADRAGLSASDSRIMVACGAGLAAVYNVPLGGAFFILEVLLGTFRLAAVIPAVATSFIAALVAWIGLGDEVQYSVEPFSVSASLVVWSILTGPIFGFAGYWFVRLPTAARARAPRDARLLAWGPITFLAIGFLAVPFPQLLGDGRGPAQLGFHSALRIGLAATLLVLKVVVVAASLRAGASGGLLTPSIAIGALLATVLGNVWNFGWPTAPTGAFAIVGGAAFLAASMKMPMTAICLMIEFTRVPHDFWVPIGFSVAGAIAVFQFFHHRFSRGDVTESPLSRSAVRAPDLR